MPEETNQKQEQIVSTAHKIRKWLWPTIVLLILIGIGASVWAVYFEKTNKNSVSDTDEQNNLLENGHDINDRDLFLPDGPDKNFKNLIIIENASSVPGLGVPYGSLTDTIHILRHDKTITTIQTSITPNERASYNPYELVSDKIYFYNFKDRMIEWMDFSGTIHPLNYTRVEESTYSDDFLISPDMKKIAWVETNFINNVPNSKIKIADIDGNNQAILVDRNLENENHFELVDWSNTGDKIYFSEQLGGLGGYIIFGGYFNLSVVDINSSEVKKLISGEEVDFITDIASDENLAVGFDGWGKAPKLIFKNLVTSSLTSVNIPINEGFKGGGSAYFSPNNKYVAYNIAHWDPDNEYYKTMLVDVTGQNLKAIIDEPDEIFQVVQWLTNHEIVVQNSGDDYFIFDTESSKLEKIITD